MKKLFEEPLISFGMGSLEGGNQCGAGSGDGNGCSEGSGSNNGCSEGSGAEEEFDTM